MSWQTIVTKEAIINGTYALIREQTKYFLSKKILDDVSLNDVTIYRMVYRRFVRLRPFISRRKMVRNTYTDYLRYKFKKEDYNFKRSVLFTTPSECSIREQLWNSLVFITKSVCYLPETRLSKFDIARDNTFCRQILKNILTMEYQKHYLIYGGRSKKSELYSKYMKTFDHVKCESESDPKSTVIGEFERCVLYLNESLQTRL